MMQSFWFQWCRYNWI